jgi:hypothetical protein
VELLPDDTLGIIYPLIPEHTSRLFEDRKTVFVKFVGKGVSPQRLHPGSKLFIYESKGRMEIVGEAKIVEIGTATFGEVLEKYGDRLFLTPEELHEYVGDRIAKRMLVLVITNPRRYKSPIQLAKSVTMAGRYMTKGLLENLKQPG